MAGSTDIQVPRAVGRYQVYGEIAAGGMATVHFGRLSGPVGFSRTVAIKRLHPQYAKDPDFVTMFLDEARICGRIRHPNVVPTLDVVTTDGEIFIVMEYVPGEAFSKLLRAAQQHTAPTNAAMPAKVAATILSSVLHGLHAAHITKDEHGRELGIVHRDVSPQNVLVGADGIARVLDFGVAKAAGRIQTTREGQVKGKIAYMPPEQLSGGAVTRQADVYAAAVVLWEALTGRRLFDGETEALVLVRAIEGRIEVPSTFNTSLDANIDAVVMKGLARNAEDRYATAREMALAVEQTIGLASPSEVGEWVERVAGKELDLRQARIAEIESASMRSPPSEVKIAAGPTPELPSQVSSISVSRPAISVLPSSPRNNITRVVLGVALLLALVGIGLGGLAVQDVFAGRQPRSHEPPNSFEPDHRTYSLLSAPTAPDKVKEHATHVPAPPVFAGPVTTTPPKVSKACDPPYTIDPVSGRKKYKLECLH